jgi:hypothetical protein
LDYWQPKIGIGVAWPNPKNYRYQMESVPILDGPNGTCARYSSQSGKIANWWVHEIKEPKRGLYVFTAAVSFQRGENDYDAVLNHISRQRGWRRRRAGRAGTGHPDQPRRQCPHADGKLRGRSAYAHAHRLTAAKLGKLAV